MRGGREGGGRDHVCAHQDRSVPVPEAGGNEKGARTEARDERRWAGVRGGMRAARRETGLRLPRHPRGVAARTALLRPSRTRPTRHGAPDPLSPDEASEPTPRPLPPAYLTGLRNAALTDAPGTREATSGSAVRSRDAPARPRTCVTPAFPSPHPAPAWPPRSPPRFDLAPCDVAGHALLVSRTLTRSKGGRSDAHGAGPPASLGPGPHVLPAPRPHTLPRDLGGGGSHPPACQVPRFASPGSTR